MRQCLPLYVRWQTCSNDGVCDGIWIYDLDMTKSASGWESELDIPNAADPSKSARPYGYNYGDYFYIMIDGVDSLNNNYKTTRAVEPLYKWTVTQDLPPASQMDDAMIVSHVEKLNEKIDIVKEQIAEESSDELELQLIDLEFQLELACRDVRVTCTEDETSGTSTDESSSSQSNTILIAGVVIAIIIVALLGGMFLLRGRGEDELEGFKWANTTLPAQDAIANRCMVAANRYSNSLYRAHKTTNNISRLIMQISNNKPHMLRQLNQHHHRIFHNSQ